MTEDRGQGTEEVRRPKRVVLASLISAVLRLNISCSSDVWIRFSVLGPLSSVFCLLLAACENDLEKVNDIGARKPNVEEAFNVQSLLSQNGTIKAKLIAPYMLRYSLDTAYLEFTKTLHVNFYDSTGKIESQLDARYGKYLETRGKVYLRDSVVVFNTAGDTLRAPDLWWDQNTKKFYTDNFVRFKSATKTIYGGKGFEAEQDLSKKTIFQPTGIFQAPADMQ